LYQISSAWIFLQGKSKNEVHSRLKGGSFPVDFGPMRSLRHRLSAHVYGVRYSYVLDCPRERSSMPAQTATAFRNRS